MDVSGPYERYGIDFWIEGELARTEDGGIGM